MATINQLEERIVANPLFTTLLVVGFVLMAYGALSHRGVPFLVGLTAFIPGLHELIFNTREGDSDG